MIIMTSWVTWCGSHIGKTGKIWTSVSLKPHQGKNWNLGHSKYSSWRMTVFFMMALVPLLWRHNCICRTLHPISMKIFESHLVIRQPYCFFWFFLTSEIDEQIEAKLYKYDRLSMRNKRITHMMSLVTWFGRHIGFTLKHIKIFFSRTAGQI